MSPVYERKDRFYQKAKEKGLASRAIFKLDEIDKSFGLIHSKDRVLDLGCAPGGWLQYIAQKIGPEGRAVGVDLLPLKIKLPPSLSFIQGDATLPEIQKKIIQALEGPAHIILSDMSPNLTGIRFRDTYLSYELAETVFQVGLKILKPGGHLLLKIFPGEESENFKKKMKSYFRELKIFIPEATRKGSSEVYFIAKNFTPNS